MIFARIGIITLKRHLANSLYKFMTYHTSFFMHIAEYKNSPSGSDGLCSIYLFVFERTCADQNSLTREQIRKAVAKPARRPEPIGLRNRRCF